MEPRMLSAKDVLKKLKSILVFIISYWKFHLLALILGVVFSLLYLSIRPVRYTSNISFLVEDSKSGSGISALANQFGFDLAGVSGGGVMAGDNITYFLRSESLLKEILLMPYDSIGKVTLADKYAEINGFKSKWSKKGLGQINFFQSENLINQRTKDSLLKKMIKRILMYDLKVARIDKKSSIFMVQAVSKDEKLSYLLSNFLVQKSVSNFLESKLKIKRSNIKNLENRADSLSKILTSKTIESARSQIALTDINPALRMSSVPIEVSNREKTMTASIFSEVVKNLEVSRTLISQETPIIQVIDKSFFPLDRSDENNLKIILYFEFIFLGMSIIVSVIKFFIKFIF